MVTLTTLTTNVNLFALAISLWLGLYVTTRSRTSRTAWLAAATLWALAAVFFQNALVLNVPDIRVEWMRLLAILVVPLWMHLTFLLLPPGMRQKWMQWGVIPLAYVLGILLVGLGVFTDLLLGPQVGDPLYATTRAPGPLYILLLPLLIVGTAIDLWNLERARQANRNVTQRGQFNALIAATLLVALASAYVTVTTYFGWMVPFLPADLLYFAGVFLFRICITRYNATLEGRPIDRDFLYTLVVVGSLTLFYCFVVWVLYVTNQVSFLLACLDSSRDGARQFDV